MNSLSKVMVEPPIDLASRYIENGWWNGSSMQSLLDTALGANGAARFMVHSTAHPFDGTVADVRALAERLAGAIHAAGISDGDTVAFQLPNWMEAAASFWGLSAAGVTLVPIPHLYGTYETRYILKQTGARAFIIAEQFGARSYLEEVEAMRGDLPALEHVIVVGASPMLPSWAARFEAFTDAAPWTARTARPGNAAVIGYTSGTSASPKGVILSHRALAFEVREHMVPLMAPRGTPLTASPVSHVAAMLVALLVAPVLGRDIHLLDRWDPGVALQLSRAHGLTAVAGAAVFLTTVIDHPDFRPQDALNHLRTIGVGGSPVPAALVERAEALGISVERTYGATEHPSVCGLFTGAALEERLDTNGRPLVGVEVKFVDDDGNPVPTGTPGELLSRGPDRCSGYLDPTLTADAIDSDGWLHTGDIGFYDSDGYIHISDRLKDIIIRGGENISAAEVEEHLLSFPGVAEVAVVAAPDERFGERPFAFVRVIPGATAPTLADLRGHLATHGLGRQKWPEDLRCTDDMPRTASGKIKKAVLREQLRAEHGA